MFSLTMSTDHTRDGEEEVTEESEFLDSSFSRMVVDGEQNMTHTESQELEGFRADEHEADENDQEEEEQLEEEEHREEETIEETHYGAIFPDYHVPSYVTDVIQAMADQRSEDPGQGYPYYDTQTHQFGYPDPVNPVHSSIYPVTDPSQGLNMGSQYLQHQQASSSSHSKAHIPDPQLKYPPPSPPKAKGIPPKDGTSKQGPVKSPIYKQPNPPPPPAPQMAPRQQSNPMAVNPLSGIDPNILQTWLQSQGITSPLRPQYSGTPYNQGNPIFNQSQPLIPAPEGPAWVGLPNVSYSLVEIAKIFDLWKVETFTLDFASLTIHHTYKPRSIIVSIDCSAVSLLRVFRTINDNLGKEKSIGTLLSLGFKPIDALLFYNDPGLFQFKQIENLHLQIDSEWRFVRTYKRTWEIIDDHLTKESWLLFFLNYLVTGEAGKIGSTSRASKIIVTIAHKCVNVRAKKLNKMDILNTKTQDLVANFTDHPAGICFDYTIDEEIKMIRLSKEVLNRLYLNVAGHRWVKMVDVIIKYPAVRNYHTFVGYDNVTNENCLLARQIFYSLYENYSPGVIYKQLFPAFRSVKFGSSEDGLTTFSQMIISLFCYIGFDVSLAREKNKGLFRNESDSVSIDHSLTLRWVPLKRTLGTKGTQVKSWNIFEDNVDAPRPKEDLDLCFKALGYCKKVTSKTSVRNRFYDSVI
jgi:hypothetical protein